MPSDLIELRVPEAYLLFEDLKLSDEDIEFYLRLAEENDVSFALEEFVQDYCISPASKYQDIMADVLSQSLTGEVQEKNFKGSLVKIGLITAAVVYLFRENFSKFLKNVYSKVCDKQSGFKEGRDVLIEEVIGRYEQQVTTAMNTSQLFVMGGLRTIQREVVFQNILLKKGKYSEEAISNMKNHFRRSLESKYPEIFRGINKKNLLRITKLDGTAETVRAYKITDYIDLVTQTAILNYDRHSNIIVAELNNEKAVEYVIANPRQVKKERAICQKILHLSVLGKSILALDGITAKKLGIMTVDEAMTTPDYAMGNFCRHTIKRLDADYLQSLDELLMRSN